MIPEFLDCVKPLVYGVGTVERKSSKLCLSELTKNKGPFIILQPKIKVLLIRFTLDYCLLEPEHRMPILLQSLISFIWVLITLSVNFMIGKFQISFLILHLSEFEIGPSSSWIDPDNWFSSWSLSRFSAWSRYFF